MNVLHLNSYYAAGKFYKNLYEIQVQNGLDIDVIVPVKSLSEIEDFNYGKYTDFRHNFNNIDRYFFHVKHNKILKDILENYIPFEYNLIHAHTLFSNGYIAMKLKEKYNVPYIVAVRSADVITFFKKMVHLRKMGIEILTNAQRIIFLSPSHRDYTIKTYIPIHLQQQIYDKVSVIPNGIHQFWFDHLGMPKLAPKTTELKIVQVGDINKNKNIETTIKAINLLIKEGFRIELTLVGKVKDQRIFDRIKNLSYVNYLGYKTREELLEIYRKNDIFVLPSISETFGLVYAEAMSQGLPLIYSEGQGFDGQFEEGQVGYRVRSLDEADIADKIKKTLNRYEEISKACLKGSETFKWEDIADEYQKIYSNTVIRETTHDK